MRKRDLTIKLQKVAPHPAPKVLLEQYTVPADLATDILFIACYVHDDIEGKCVADLGTGTGRLALGVSLLGAEHVVGVDIDLPSLVAASQNANVLNAQVDWVLGDINTLRGRFDTVIMNPPFGTKKPHADIEFLQAALALSRVVYSIHKSSTRGFISGWLKEEGAESERIISTNMEIPHQFSYHRRRKEFVGVDVFRINRREVI